MAPPMQHPLYHILEVEYDDQHRAHILSDNDAEVALPPLRPRMHTTWDLVGYVELMSNEYCRPKLVDS